MFKTDDIFSYLIMALLLISIILLTRHNSKINLNKALKKNKKNHTMLVICIVLSFFIMYFNNELGIFILILTFIMYFTLTKKTKKELFETQSLQDRFGKSEAENKYFNFEKKASDISNKFIRDIEVILTDIKNVLTRNKDLIKELEDKSKIPKIKCSEDFENIIENFPRDNVPSLNKFLKNNIKNNYKTQIKDNPNNKNNFGEPLNNSNYSKEQYNKLGCYFYPLNK